MNDYPSHISAAEQHARLMAYAQTLGLLDMPIESLLQAQTDAFGQASAAKETMYQMPNPWKDTKENADALLSYSVLVLDALFYAVVLWHREAPEHKKRWSDARRLVTDQRAYDDQDRDVYHQQALMNWMSRLEFYVSRKVSGASMEPEDLYPALATQSTRTAAIYQVEYTGVPNLFSDPQNIL